jgi:hypothetical protein
MATTGTGLAGGGAVCPIQQSNKFIFGPNEPSVKPLRSAFAILARAR